MDKQPLQKGLKKRGLKVLIVKPSSLGDVVHSLPFLFTLKKCVPEARVHWVIADSLAGLLEGHLLIERLWVINKDNWKKPGRILETTREFRRLSKALKEEKFDFVFDLQGLLRSALITRAAKAPYRVGFREAREGGPLFYTHRVEGGGKIHAVERYLKMAEFAGCRPELEFPLPRMEGYAPPPGEYAVILPGARWDSKRWPVQRFAELARRLPMRSVVLGGPSDMSLADRLVEQAGGKAVSLAGRSTLKELVEIIRYSRFMVTNDSGPMHIAAALGIPVFAVFGPTDPALTGPYGKGPRVVVREAAKCAPCRKRRCNEMKCMDAVSVDMVHEEIKKEMHF
ncbi:MAG: lipopolysaccharide heptosyltransferase I [Nitrospiraceae bacterium]|nr:lipopolysaccharide heptosyltransferase I [Nitrospiraceae bacterium]